MSKFDSIRRLIQRTRLRKFGMKQIVAKSLREIVVPHSLQYTIRGAKFYFEDSGPEDKNRIILFTTRENLRFLDKQTEWYIDGTFDVAPSFFKQVYTIHCVKDNSVLPMVYALLPNKKQVTYKKMLLLIKHHLTSTPKFVNCDFELAAINAVRMILQCDIGGCFFHFSQAIYKKIKSYGNIFFNCLILFFFLS